MPAINENSQNEQMNLPLDDCAKRDTPDKDTAGYEASQEEMQTRHTSITLVCGDSRQSFDVPYENACIALSMMEDLIRVTKGRSGKAKA